MLTALLALALTLAQPATAPAQAVDPARVAAAHGRQNLPAGAVFHGRITVEFGENKLLDDAEIWFEPSAAVVRIETGDATAVADGKSRPSSARPMPTWPGRAFSFTPGPTSPWPPSSSTTRARGWSRCPLPRRATGRPIMPAPSSPSRAGTGDAPDDWYVLYVNGEDRLTAMAYIVTYGKTKEQAEAEPHAIVYGDFADVPGPDGGPSGVIVSTRWTFRDWSADRGVHGDVRGTATLTNLRLEKPRPGLFDPPADAREVLVPR